MKAEIGVPDASPPGVRRLGYAVFCWFNRHPMVWRTLGAALRYWPFLSRLVPFAGRRSAVLQVLSRPRSFSNTAHAVQLIAGDFQIGMDPGPEYDADKAIFDSLLASLDVEADADAQARSRVAGLAERLRGPVAGRSFDLLEDYLMWIVLRAVQPALGAAAESVISGSRECVPDERLERDYLHELRHVAAHLFAGELAPLAVQRRAEVNAASLRARIEAMTPELSMSWPQAATAPYKAIRRTAIGLAWVSHPVTVQSGALAFQELLRRPAVYRALRRQVAALGAGAWDRRNAAFRTLVRDHVLELMRFRPVFPLLARDVPRATEYESGGRRNPVCPAGSSQTVLSISALFDAHGVPDAAAYCPHRQWGDAEPSRYLMFGYGDRQCPARTHAVDMLGSALIGLLTLPELRLTRRGSRGIRYDGPMISSMRLRPA